jgi:serine carboxypeptidase 1
MAASLLKVLAAVCLTLILVSLWAEAKKDSESFVPHVSKRGQNAEGTEKWAYVDVRPQTHMFYWLYYTYHPDGYENRPWILWLQGGPGASGCGYGNFELIGPLDLKLEPRVTTWVNQSSVLFIDNPVGSGYSYVDNLTALTTDVQEITDDLIVVLKAVLEESPEFKTRPFFIFGQSYGGKMGAHLARQLYDEILQGNIDMQLVGFAMGNSWVSPIDSTLTWGPLLYWMSLTDHEGYMAIQRAANLTRDAVDEGRWVDATNLWRSTQGVVRTRTNRVDFYNILKFITPSQAGRLFASDFGYLYKQIYRSSSKVEYTLDELMNGPIKEKLGIIPDNVRWGAQSDDVFDYQSGDFMKPVIYSVDSALKETALRVIVYQGQLDLICDNVGAMDWVDQLTWDQMGNYHGAVRRAFTKPEDGQTDMFVKAFNRFKFYWVLGAGHAVPKDNGWTAYRMLERILADLDV